MTDLSRLSGRERQVPEALLIRARQLRQQQTCSEQILWECLRARRLNGVKFRRQHNIGQLIADFYCHKARLVIEIDGSIHQSRTEQDAERDAWMQACGLQVLRVTNEEVQNHLESILSEILRQVSKPLSPGLPCIHKLES
ncbi:endonuclease domain-containing protein [Romeria aff. gracilis LEGE 07310]|uniref:Endonuclease domain-containing protein n=1 Tax=Vasconcelosia minhoensis LEGE 07310 TaxID=915328 RepID=A0A8J7DCD1_9CYAN|nr:endonuclease domain-containing protein [Romeria aff. gracilis LEGE 07310]